MSKTKTKRRTTKKRNPDCLTRYAVTSSNVNIFGDIVDFEILGKFKNEDDAVDLFSIECIKEEKTYYCIIKLVDGHPIETYSNPVVDCYYQEKARKEAIKLGLPFEMLSNKIVCDVRI